MGSEGSDVGLEVQEKVADGREKGTKKKATMDHNHMAGRNSKWE